MFMVKKETFEKIFHTEFSKMSLCCDFSREYKGKLESAINDIKNGGVIWRFPRITLLCPNVVFVKSCLILTKENLWGSVF